MVRDDVYEKLLEIKGDKSQVIEEQGVFRRKMEKYFGILSEEEAESFIQGNEGR